MDFLKIVEAPKWFLKVIKEIEKYQQTRLDLLGVDKARYMADSEKILKGRLSKEEQRALASRLAIETKLNNPELYSDEVKEKCVAITDIIESLEAYMWRKFRYENFGNTFGKAENLRFNKIQNTIHIIDEDE